MNQQKLTYAGQLKPGLIISIKNKNNLTEKIKVIKNVYSSDIQFTNQWQAISKLLKQEATIVGEIRKFLWIIPYKHYYQK